jgi:hypothetical protein
VPTLWVRVIAHGILDVRLGCRVKILFVKRRRIEVMEQLPEFA